MSNKHIDFDVDDEFEEFKDELEESFDDQPTFVKLHRKSDQLAREAKKRNSKPYPRVRSRESLIPGE